MTRADLYQFIQSHRWGVEASVTSLSSPQAALVGIAVTPGLEIVFDTLNTTRKFTNLRSNHRIAFVIGGWLHGDERTVQYEGVADTPDGEDLERLKEVYYAAFPDGRQRQTWPGLVYVRATPTWIRYCDFNQDPPEIHEFTFPERSRS